MATRAAVRNVMTIAAVVLLVVFGASRLGRGARFERTRADTVQRLGVESRRRGQEGGQ